MVRTDLNSNFLHKTCMRTMGTDIERIYALYIDRVHRRLLRGHFGHGRRKSRVVKALALLVESGTIYCLLLVSLVPPPPRASPHPSVYSMLTVFEFRSRGVRVATRSSWSCTRRAPRSSPRQTCTRTRSSARLRTTPTRASSPSSSVPSARFVVSAGLSR